MTRFKFINYRNDSGKIETVESFGDFVVGAADSRSRCNILEEYRKVDSRYYPSNRGSKEYYEELKNNK